MLDQIWKGSHFSAELQSIVESHGGSLRLARGVRSGAMFIFDLPTNEAETSADAG
jgi:K+-sensing histidine kinase KdpD